MTMKQSLRLANIVLSLGLVLLLERFKLDPRWKYLVWGLIAANEIRGLIVVWQVGAGSLRAVGYPV